MPMRDEVFQDCFEHWSASNGRTSFWPDLAKKWGYSNAESLRGTFKRERRRRGIPSKKEVGGGVESNTYKEESDSIHIVCASERIKTKEEIIKEFDINTDIWELISFEVKTSEGYRKDREVKWEVVNGQVISGHVDDSGKMLVVPLYHTRAKFIKKTLAHISLDDIKRFLVSRNIEIPKITPQNYSPTEEILEVNMTDIHLGNDANHSPEKRLSYAVDDVVKRIGKRKFSKIILSILGDIFHYDNVNKTTSSGTIVTTNGMTAYETFDLGQTTMIDNIMKLASLVPLEIISVPGNHDPMIGYTLIKVLEAYFKETKSIRFDSKHDLRKFRRLDKNLVAWMHGEMPDSRAMDWLQVEAAKEWGKSKYREIHAGNFHSRKMREEGGVIIQYLPGMTNIDDWHDRKGFVGAIKGMMSFVWGDNIGWREQWFTSVEDM